MCGRRCIKGRLCALSSLDGTLALALPPYTTWMGDCCAVRLLMCSASGVERALEQQRRACAAMMRVRLGRKGGRFGLWSGWLRLAVNH